MLNYSILLAAWVFMVWLETAGTLRAMSLKETGLARRRPRMAGLLAIAGGLVSLAIGVMYPITAWCWGLYPDLGVIATVGACIAIIGMIVLVRRGLRTINGIPVAARWLGNRPWVHHVMAWIGLVLLIFTLDALTKSRLAGIQSDITAARRTMRANVSPENNAREDYVAAFPLLRNLDPEVMDWLMTDEIASAPPVLSEQMRRAVVLLRDAASKPQVDWGDELAQKIADPDRDLKLFRQSANLLRIDALNSAMAGQMRDAIADVRAMEQIARHVGQGPSLMEGLVAIGIQGMADRTVSDLLPFVKQVEDLQNLKLPDGQWYRQVSQRMLEGEKLGVTQQLINMAFGKIPGKGIDTKMPAPLAGLYRLFLVEADIRAWQKQVDRLVDSTSLQSRQALVRTRQLEQEWESRGWKDGLFVPMQVRPTGTTASVLIRAEMESQLRNVGIAIKKYSLENHAWPASLQDLVTRGYLQQIPLDLFSDGLVLMATKPDGVVVYSVGENGKDDGGTGQRNEDITFLVSDKPLWERHPQ